jgi:hypothetical protein
MPIQSLSRNGFSSDDVRRALHSPHGTRKVLFSYDLLNRQGQYKCTLDTVTSGNVSFNALDEIKRKARFALRDDGTIDFLSDRIRPSMSVWVNGTRSYAIDSQADWQAGTLPPQADATSSAGDVKLYRANGTFSRASVAYLPDGTQVASAIARYWWGRWQNNSPSNSRT